MRGTSSRSGGRAVLEPAEYEPRQHCAGNAAARRAKPLPRRRIHGRITLLVLRWTRRCPARGERGCVESLGGIERLRRLLGRVSAEGTAQCPLATESEEAQPVVGQVGNALRVEVQVDR